MARLTCVAWSFTFLLMTALPTACAPPGDPTALDRPAQQQAGQTPIDCHNPVNVRAGLCAKVRGDYFRDEQDGGDAPLTPGCHVNYTDPVCSANATNYSGDLCTDSNNLVEFTDSTCHTAPDRKPYDCDAYCRQLGHAAGECRTVSEQFCAPHGSAYCKCTGVT